MYAFLNPETHKVVVYDNLIQASLQALLVGQYFISAFDEDVPYIMELTTTMKEEEEDNEA